MVVEGSEAKPAVRAYREWVFLSKGKDFSLERPQHGRERRWHRPEASGKASGSIRNRREAVKKGVMKMPARETAGKQEWVLEMLGKLLKGWSNVTKI